MSPEPLFDLTLSLSKGGVAPSGLLKSSSFDKLRMRISWGRRSPLAYASFSSQARG